MFIKSKRTLTLLVAAVAVALVWGTLSLSAPPEGKGKPPKGDEDTTPPAAVDTLVVSSVTSSSIVLEWLAVADDGNDLAGDPAAVYDIRYSTTPILTDADFDSATMVLCDPVPADPGEPEMVTVGDLSELTEYWLALKVADTAGNWSALSNLAVDDMTGMTPITDVTPSGEWAIEVVDPLAGQEFQGTLALAYDLSENPKPSIAYYNHERFPNGNTHSPLRLARWNGSTWEIELIEDLVHHTGVDLAFDPDTGWPTLSYGFSTGSQNHALRTLNFASRDPVNGWSWEIVDDSQGWFKIPSLAYGSNNNPLEPSDPPKPSISYHLWPTKNQKNPGLKFAYLDGSSWVTEMVDPGVDSRHNIGNSLAYDPVTGEATIAYHRGDDTLKFFRRDATTGSWNSGELVTTVGFQTGREGSISLAYVPDKDPSIPSIAFQVISPENPGDDILKFAYWDKDAIPDPSWVIEEVDNGPNCEGKSLAYDAFGTAYISYTAIIDVDAAVWPLPDGVKLARRIGPGDWQIEIVTGCVAASPTSLKFDSHGNPSVGYTDSINRKLKFARIVP